MKNFLILFVTFALWGCSHPAKDLKDSHYQRVKEHTHSKRGYLGFYNKYEVDATLLTQAVKMSALQLKAEFHKWDRFQISSKREEILEDLSNHTEFLISLFTPERDHNDLAKPDSIWSIYLEVDGQRYDAKIRKRDEKLAELTALYPYHDRFRKAYAVTFNVPTRLVDEAGATLIITSSLGLASFQY